MDTGGKKAQVAVGYLDIAYAYQCEFEKGECAELQHVKDGKHARVQQRLGVPQQHRRAQQLPKHARRQQALRQVMMMGCERCQIWAIKSC